MNKKYPFVSIVIPTLLLEPNYLKNCLSSLLEINYKGDFEVIVIVNSVSSIDESVNTKKLLCSDFKKVFKKLNLSFIYQNENLGFAEAVNKGIEDSKGDYIALLNDDTVVINDWLKELVKTGASCDMVASVIYSPKETIEGENMNSPTALNKVLKQADQGEWKIDSLGFDYEVKGKANPITSFNHSKGMIIKPFGPDAAAALYSRELIDKLNNSKTGVFDKRFFAYLEDVDLAFRARSNGYKCCLADKAVVYHFKHSTSSTMNRFKAKQDMVNWWRLIIKNYDLYDWILNGFPILLERAKNFNGFLKSYIK